MPFVPPPPPTPTPAPARGRPAPKRTEDYEDRRFEERGGKEVRLYPPRRAKQPVVVPRTDRPLVLEGSMTVQELSQKMGIPAAELIKRLLNLGVMATINQELDVDTAEIVARELGFQVEVRPPALTVEEEVEQEVPDDPASLRPRPPVVTVMGHVDHGKTSLLDAIRKTNVTAQEAGGITQHIGAYTVTAPDGRAVVFLDTPGHEAFTAMRARGAKVTDVVVLVVAADDGVMPQTVEAIHHARAAEVPIVVAINKIDKPEAQPERVKQQLAEHELVPEEWGGDTIMVPVSARTGEGLDHLLEMILLVADVRDLRANPDKLARGSVIEAKLDRGRGPVATVLVQQGTLRVGDAFVCGRTYGRVRAMLDDRGRPVKEAPPSTPVEVLGFSEVPEAGDVFLAVEDEKKARAVAALRQERYRQADLRGESRSTLGDLMQRMQGGDVRHLNVILKADVQGSVEAVRTALERLSTDEVKIRVLHEGVGAISESDVMLASASRALLIGFNVRPDTVARQLAEQEQVDVRTYRVIYDVVDDVRQLLTGMQRPVTREVVLGRAEVRATFKVPRVGTVAGLYVTEGRIPRNAQVRVVRDGVVVYDGRIDSLKRFKDDVREVGAGSECGMGLEKFQDVKEGDVIEAYTVEEVKAG